MREAEEAENAGRWDDAANAYYRAERIKPHDANAENAWRRVEEKRRLAEYAEAMARGKAAEQSNNWETALREYENALMRKSNDAEAKDSIARAQYQLRMKEGREAEQQQRWDMALIAYSRALAVKRGDVEATEAERRVRKLRAEKTAPEIVADAPTQISQSKTDSKQTTLSGKLPEQSPPRQQTAPAVKPVDVRVNLRWNAAELEKSALAQPQSVPSAQSQLKRSIARKILERSGQDTIAVTTLPKGDKDGWWCVKWYDSAADEPKRLYRYLGEHLLIADHYLANGENIAQKRQGLGIALHAATALNDGNVDRTLAAAICDAFVLPNLELAAPGQCDWTSERNILEQLGIIFEEAKLPAKVEAVYKLLLEKAPNRNTADYARYKLAQLYFEKARYEEALACLKAIDPKEGMGGVKEFIPVVEKKMQGKAQKGGVR
jgi:tetratricopeptide (TPR) repeat protein